jgi:hypothetical protein
VHTAKTLPIAHPIIVVAEWIKGRYDGEYREYRYDLNDQVDRLATNFNRRPPAGFIQKKMPSPIPNYAVQLLYDGSTITTCLYQIMSQQFHRKKIYRLHQKEEWLDRQVNWNAHVMAFKQLTRDSQILVAKLNRTPGQGSIGTTNQSHSHQHSIGGRKCSDSWHAPMDHCPTKRTHKSHGFDSRIP